MLNTRRAISGQSGKTEFTVNFGHALLILERGALAAENGVHFLERKPLGFGDNEPDESGAERGDEAKENVGSVRDALEEVGRDLANNEVVHPVGGAAERGTVGTS
jgi:hypothetical protein